MSDKTTRVEASFEEGAGNTRDPNSDPQIRAIMEGGPGAPQIRSGKDYVSYQAGWHSPTLEEEAARLDKELAKQGMTSEPVDSSASRAPMTEEQAAYATAMEVYSSAANEQLLAINTPEDLAEAMQHRFEGQDRAAYDSDPKFRALVDASVKRGMLSAANAPKIGKQHALSGLEWSEQNLPHILQSELDEQQRERLVREYGSTGLLTGDLEQAQNELAKAKARVDSLQALKARLRGE